MFDGCFNGVQISGVGQFSNKAGTQLRPIPGHSKDANWPCSVHGLIKVNAGFWNRTDRDKFEVTPWSRPGHACGLYAEVDSSRLWTDRVCGLSVIAVRTRARLLRGLSGTCFGCCANAGLETARTIRRMLRGLSTGLSANRRADVARPAALPSCKGMVSSKNQGFQVSESRQRFLSAERVKLDDNWPH